MEILIGRMRRWRPCLSWQPIRDFSKANPLFWSTPFLLWKKGWNLLHPFWICFFGVCVIHFLDVESLFIEFLFFLLIQPIGTTPLSELLRRKGAGPCRSPVFYFFEISVTPNENEKTRMYTKPWYHVLMNAKKIIPNEIEMKPNWQNRNEIVFQRILETWVREFPGGSYVVVGKERERVMGRRVFSIRALIYTLTLALTHTHTFTIRAEGVGWGVISSCQSVHTLPVRFFSSSFWRIVKQQHRETSGFIKYWMGSRLFEFFGTRRR